MVLDGSVAGLDDTFVKKITETYLTPDIRKLKEKILNSPKADLLYQFEINCKNEYLVEEITRNAYVFQKMYENQKTTLMIESTLCALVFHIANAKDFVRFHEAAPILANIMNSSKGEFPSGLEDDSEVVFELKLIPSNKEIPNPKNPKEPDIIERTEITEDELIYSRYYYQLLSPKIKMERINNSKNQTMISFPFGIVKFILELLKDGFTGN